MRIGHSVRVMVRQRTLITLEDHPNGDVTVEPVAFGEVGEVGQQHGVVGIGVPRVVMK